jgi:tRNA modification GTPase
MLYDPEKTYAARITPAGQAAIGTVGLLGPGAFDIASAIFRGKSDRPFKLQKDMHALGYITCENESIDQVILGVEDENFITIHCHGNPLIITQTLRLLERSGAVCISGSEFYEIKYLPGSTNYVEYEAKIERLTAVSILGVKLIESQQGVGLASWCRDAMAMVEQQELSNLHSQAGQILTRSRFAKPFIKGARIVIAGPPNSGKSSLLNAMAGRPEAIVTDLPGTTRDFLTAPLKIASTEAELIDTAGLDDSLNPDDELEQMAQHSSCAFLDSADIVIYVLDSAKPLAESSLEPLTRSILPKSIIVLNKSDLPGKITPEHFTKYLREKSQSLGISDSMPDILKVSALTGFNIAGLIETISAGLSVSAPEPGQPICFTERQSSLLAAIAEEHSAANIKTHIQQLLKLPESV